MRIFHRLLMATFIFFGLVACGKAPSPPSTSLYKVSADQNAFMEVDIQNHSLLNLPPKLVLRLQNISGQPLVLDFATRTGSAQAGLASKIDPQHYSILDQGGREPLHLACLAIQKDGQYTRVDCHDKILVQAVKGQFSREVGHYWVTENQPIPH